MIKDSSNLWDRLTDQLKVKYSKTDEESRQMAKDILVKRKHLTDNGELTDEGRMRSLMGAEGRALDRAVKSSGGTTGDYLYNPETNRTRRM